MPSPFVNQVLGAVKVTLPVVNQPGAPLLSTDGEYHSWMPAAHWSLKVYVALPYTYQKLTFFSTSLPPNGWKFGFGTNEPAGKTMGPPPASAQPLGPTPAKP